MLIVGLTGSIGMGKSTVASWFEARGVCVWDADAAVHNLYNGGAAVALIEEILPQTISAGVVDRTALSVALQQNPHLFPRIEAIVHPLVRETQRQFLCSAATSQKSLALLDIPLLFETRGDARVDVAVVVHAPQEVQRARVLARPGMTAEAFNAILARQMPSEEKCRYADFVIETHLTLAESRAQTDRLVDHLFEQQGTAFRRLWMAANGAI